MNTDEAIEYLNYTGPIWLRKIEFIPDDDNCGCDNEKATDHE